MTLSGCAPARSRLAARLHGHPLELMLGSVAEDVALLSPVTVA
jgi:hypothetical protein